MVKLTICEYYCYLNVLLMSEVLLGLDIGSSSIKATLVDAETGQSLAAAQSPSEEMAIVAVEAGWAEQDPSTWWEHVGIAVRDCLRKSGAAPERVTAIGISYQMHGLVIVGKNLEPLRPSIIWCDSRAVATGEKAMQHLGAEYCLPCLLNSPGNFTASKLRWVKENEPDIFARTHKFMLPGDYIAMRLTGEITTTDTGLSEGIFWDYAAGGVSRKLMDHYGFDTGLVPDVKPVFSVHGEVSKAAAEYLGIKAGTKVSYRAGDQPNNAFSLNVLNPGEIAATAGTSGVIYGVTEKNAYDVESRVNTFIHVNNTAQRPSNGVLLCINGTGILNSWLRRNMRAKGDLYDYTEMNALTRQVPIGSAGLTVLPFGNGAERMLGSRAINASFHGLDLNRHGQAHLFRAAQEGIVFSLKYGFDILQAMGLRSNVIRAGKANMFLSPLFREAFVNTIGARLELYNTDGAKGAALGAGVGAGVYKDFGEAFRGLKVLESEAPDENKTAEYLQAYERWKARLALYL